jgi:hypothetical protein
MNEWTAASERVEVSCQVGQDRMRKRMPVCVFIPNLAYNLSLVQNPLVQELCVLR